MTDRSGRSLLVRARSRAFLPAVSVLVFGVAACQDAAGPDVSQTPSRPFASFGDEKRRVADEYIVVFESGVSDVEGRAKGLVNAHGGALQATYSAALQGFSARLSERAAEAISNLPDVAYVEQNQAFDLAGTQTGAAWGLDRIDQATLPLDGTFNYPTTGSGVNVYIIDSGIRLTHVEFGGRAASAYSSVSSGYDGCHWHGTHVAGIVGGAVYGVAKAVRLHSVRAYDCSGVGTSASILAAVDWVTAHAARPAVANLSISGGLSSALNSAVQSSINAGVTYVVAAGNNVGSDACNYSPSSVGSALTVAAIAGTDLQTSYTNVGSCVDLYAPGTQIYSAVSTGDTDVSLFSGTSQASAFVAGAAALYLASNPGASPAEVGQFIVSSATVGVVGGITGGTPNRLLRVSGSGGGGGSDPLPPPPPPPENTAPVANFTSSCSKANCSFDGSSSTDDSAVRTYSWNFGDGTSASGSSPTTTHVYAAKGNYTVYVTLTVTDDTGLQSSVQKSINIRNKGR